MSQSLLDRILGRHQTATKERDFKKGQRRENFDSKLSKVVPAFLEKVSRTSDKPNAPMFPLSHDDLIVVYKGEKRMAWYLAADYSDHQTIVYLLDDGTTVSHQDLHDKNVTDFDFSHAGPALTERAVQRLKKYLAISDESFKPINDGPGRIL